MIRVSLKRLDPDLPAPARMRAGDAAVDLPARADSVVPAGGRALVPTGFAIAIPEGGVLARPESDYDNDGRSNWYEYLFGTDMANAEDGGAASTTYSPVDQTITYTRRATATDATWRHEVSSDLATWKHNGDASGLQYTEIVSRVQDPDGTETVEVRILGDGPEAFVRVVGELATP